MTAVQPRRQGPPTGVGGPAVSLAHVYRLYRFYDEGGVLLYVGITGRVPFRRLMEHVCDKPWAAQMARWEVDPHVWAAEAEVLAAEKAAIITERPRYNIAHNGNNPARTWGPRPQPRRPAPPRIAPSPARRVLTSRLTWWLLGYVRAVAVSWWAIGWVDAHVPQVVVPTSWRLVLSASLPVVDAVAVWCWWATTGRRRWRRVRRTFR